MIPNRAYFPGGLAERAVWCTNFRIQFTDVAVSLGFTVSEATEIALDCTLIEDLADIQAQLDAYTEAVRQYRIIITEGDVGDPTPAFPDFPSYASPVGQPTGAFERIATMVKRIRVAPAYTDEIGALLGILPQNTSRPPDTELKPLIKASESFNNYQFTVNVTRLGMTAYKVQVQRSGQSTWTDVTFATNNPSDVTVTPTTPGQPERILVRAILLKDNQPIGIPSDPTYVTVNP